jgi:hypothetical protein
MTSADLECELEQYVKTALWSTNDDTEEPLDSIAGPENIALDCLALMRADLTDFIEHADPAELDFWQAELGPGQVDHDFWLTRNSHGVGFWDRFSAGVGAIYGRSLTERSKPYGSFELYVGDDGRVHGC